MWYLCLRKATVPREQWRTPLDEHLAWMQRMHQAGSIYISGPGRDSDGTFYGVYVIRAATKGEAEKVAAADPLTVNGEASFTLIEWEVHQILGIGGFSTAALAQLGGPRPVTGGGS